MFILEEDYYFITIKILSILIALECYSKPFEDYRKLGLIFEFIKDNSNYSFYKKLMKQEEQSIFDNEKSIRILCDSKLTVAVIKRVLFFLEKQNMIRLEKNLKSGTIDVILIHNDIVDELISEEMFNEDIIKCTFIRKTISRIRSLKLDTLQSKIFGNNEAI